jgi:hypothetical protein
VSQSAAFEVGDRARLWLVHTDENRVRETISGVRWSSSAQHVLQVSGEQVVAVAPGEAQLFAEHATGVEARVITVQAKGAGGPTGLTITPASATLSVGQTINLRASEAVQWFSDDATIARVENGVVTAVAPGETFIIARSATGEVDVPVWVEGAGGCAYPNAEDFVLGGVMPRMRWADAVRSDGSPAALDLREVYCREGEYANVQSLVFIVSAAWCPGCPEYIRQVAQDAPAIEAAGGRLVVVEWQDADSQPINSADAHRHLLRTMGAQPYGIHVGGGSTQPVAGAVGDAMQAFPSAFVVRTRDMQMIANDSSLIDDPSADFLPLVDIVSNLDGDWPNGQGAPPPPPFMNACGAGVDEAGEPNDTMAQATPIAEGTHRGGICNPMGDFYRLNGEGQWRATLTFDANAADLDIYVWHEPSDGPLFNPDGTPVGSEGFESPEVFEHGGPAILAIFGYENSSAPYTLEIEYLQ